MKQLNFLFITYTIFLKNTFYRELCLLIIWRPETNYYIIGNLNMLHTSLRMAYLQDFIEILKHMFENLYTILKKCLLGTGNEQ